MQSLFGLLYAVLFFTYIATALFVIFHIVRYSLTRGATLFGVTLFGVVFLVLVFTNALIFFSLPVDDLFPRSY